MPSSALPAITAFAARIFGRVFDRCTVGLKKREVYRLAAPANLRAQITPMAALNLGSSGWNAMPCPRRPVRLVMGAGTVACTITLVGLRFGQTITKVFNVTGAGNYDGDIALDSIVSLTSNVNPVGTVDVKTGLGWGLANPCNAAELYAVDGVEAAVDMDWVSGTVRISPSAPPDGMKEYQVVYTPRFE